jgi:hypothetical protein
MMGSETPDETAKIELSAAKKIIAVHIEAYFGSTEAERRTVLGAIETAERSDGDVVSALIPGEGWRRKWPEAARAAVLALWRTPRWYEPGPGRRDGDGG